MLRRFSLLVLRCTEVLEVSLPKCGVSMGWRPFLLRRKILCLYMKNRAHFLNRAVARLYNIQKMESLREKLNKLKQILQILFG